jgi:hypothetical protein
MMGCSFSLVNASVAKAIDDVVQPQVDAEVCTESDPMLIENAEQLQITGVVVNTAGIANPLATGCWGEAIGERTDSDVYIKLTADIDLSAYSAGEGWEPIGIEGKPFSGHFDGAGHVIRNLAINRPDADNQGLFGATGTITITNLGLVDSSITGRSRVGALVGSIYNGGVYNSYSTTTVTANQGLVGGLVGYVAAGWFVILNSKNTGNVTSPADTYNTGGLVGFGSASAVVLIHSSYNSGNINGHDSVGGLIGGVYNMAIENSYNIGQISGDDNVGGLIGFANSTLNLFSVFNAGVVTGNDWDVGGIVGYIKGDNSEFGPIIISGVVSLANVTGAKNEEVSRIWGYIENQANIGFTGSIYSLDSIIVQSSCETACANVAVANDPATSSLTEIAQSNLNSVAWWSQPVANPFMGYDEPMFDPAIWSFVPGELPHLKVFDPPVPPVVSTAVTRLHNPVSGEHHYTSDENEINTLVNELGWTNEDVGWVAPTTGIPVYRLFNSASGEHHYTKDTNEINTLVNELGWTNEDVGWYSGGDEPVYRFHNPVSGEHHYTTDENEIRTLVGEWGWISEDVGWNSLG